MKLAAVCCHFNPAGYRKRVQNLDTFRRGLESVGVPVLVVELTFGDAKPEITGSDSLHFQSESVLWHKERLLHLGCEQVCGNSDVIMLLDADLIFETADWPKVLLETMERHAIVQCFEHSNMRYYGGGLRRPGFVKRLLGGDQSLHSAGLGWAIRSQEFQQGFRWYEHAIIGGGDSVFARACQVAKWDWDPGRRDVFRGVPALCSANERFRSHGRAWLATVVPRLRDGLGFAPIQIRTLPHGKLSKRSYTGRHRWIRGFVPDRDVRINDEGVFEWSSDRTDMHAAVARYFMNRHEDE